MKKLITNYTFDKSARTITFNDYSTIRQDSLLLITNTTDNVIIYNFADPNTGATVSDNIVTLSFDTSLMDNSDNLQIYYDDPDVQPSTEETQISAAEITRALYDAVDMLTLLAGVRDTQNQLRVGVVSGSVGISANQTLATLTNLVNFGGFAAQNHIPATQNMVAVYSNINNVTIA